MLWLDGEADDGGQRRFVVKTKFRFARIARRGVLRRDSNLASVGDACRVAVQIRFPHWCAAVAVGASGQGRWLPNSTFFTHQPGRHSSGCSGGARRLTARQASRPHVDVRHRSSWLRAKRLGRVTEPASVRCRYVQCRESCAYRPTGALWRLLYGRDPSTTPESCSFRARVRPRRPLIASALTALLLAGACQHGERAVQTAADVHGHDRAGMDADRFRVPHGAVDR